MTFNDLDFKPQLYGGQLQAVAFFENGYGASVITGREGMYELAVLDGTFDDWNLCYDTEITSDVIPYITEEGVTQLLHRIEVL